MDVNKKLSTVLFAEEQLLWTGQPKQGFYFVWTDILTIPFFIVIGLVPIYWARPRGDSIPKSIWASLFF